MTFVVTGDSSRDKSVLSVHSPTIHSPFRYLVFFHPDKKHVVITRHRFNLLFNQPFVDFALINLRYLHSFPFKFPFLQCKVANKKELPCKDGKLIFSFPFVAIVVTSNTSLQLSFLFHQKKRFCTKIHFFFRFFLFFCDVNTLGWVHSVKRSLKFISKLDSYMCTERKGKMFCNHPWPIPTKDNIRNHGERVYFVKSPFGCFCCTLKISLLVSMTHLRILQQKINFKSPPFSLRVQRLAAAKCRMQAHTHILMRNCAINCKTLMHHN